MFEYTVCELFAFFANGFRQINERQTYFLIILIKKYQLHSVLRPHNARIWRSLARVFNCVLKCK